MTNIDLTIKEPEVQNITAESNPDIWDVLQPPQNKCEVFAVRPTDGAQCSIV